MLVRSSDHVYRSERLLALPWLTHGFGTRRSETWPGEYTYAKQIHSDIIFSVERQNGCLGQGDALVTGTPGIIVGVRTADCVPVLLVDPVRRVVAAVHAGWRGTVQHIVTKTVGKMRSEHQVLPSDLLAVIGPCIGECCYEVGPEVSAQFGTLFPERDSLSHIDLAEANRRQLLRSGTRCIER